MRGSCWRAQGFFDGALCFFIPFVAASPRGSHSLLDIFTIGRAAYICLLGVVTIEMLIVTRFWTLVFVLACICSYFVVYPFIFLTAYMYELTGTYDFRHFGIPAALTTSAWFYVAILTVYLTAFALRLAERSAKALFWPDAVMIVSELEVIDDRAASRRGLDSVLGGAPLAMSANGVPAVRHLLAAKLCAGFVGVPFCDRSLQCVSCNSWCMHSQCSAVNCLLGRRAGRHKPMADQRRIGARGRRGRPIPLGR